MKFSLIASTILAATALAAPMQRRCDDGCRSLDLLNDLSLGSPEISGNGNPNFEGNGNGNGNGNPVADGNGNGNGNPADNGNGNGNGSANDNDPVGALGSILGLGKNE